MEYFNAIRQGTPFDTNSNRAYICLLPKLSKDPIIVSNYRPISLINCEPILLSKKHATIFNCLMYINIEQVDFIPNRQAGDQTRRALDLISLFKFGCGGRRTGMLLSFDLHKAFDTVSWPYLLRVLSKLNFGPNFFTFFADFVLD